MFSAETAQPIATLLKRTNTIQREFFESLTSPPGSLGDDVVALRNYYSELERVGFDANSRSESLDVNRKALVGWLKSNCNR